MPQIRGKTLVRMLSWAFWIGVAAGVSFLLFSIPAAILIVLVLIVMLRK